MGFTHDLYLENDLHVWWVNPHRTVGLEGIFFTKSSHWSSHFTVRLMNQGLFFCLFFERQLSLITSKVSRMKVLQTNFCELSSPCVNSSPTSTKDAFPPSLRAARAAGARFRLAERSRFWAKKIWIATVSWFISG